MSILQDTSKIQWARMESGMTFDHEEKKWMLSANTKAYGAQITNKTRSFPPQGWKATNGGQPAHSEKFLTG